jgi:murein DD-endopeptidase MepM/ murein hydrolase activator NlpD
MKKIYAAVLILILVILQLRPVIVWAQEEATASSHVEESTPSAQISTPVAELVITTPTPPLSSSGDPPADELFLGPSGTTAASAVIKQPAHVRSLAKRTFRAGEPITVVIDNAWASDVTVELFDVDGTKADVTVETVSDGDPTVLRMTPGSHFLAGRYRLKVTDGDGNTTTQDFTWGVLAINTNKSIYLPEETADIAIAVLDETGLMVCDATVTLEITPPEGSPTTLSTQDGSIKVNPECNQKKFTLTPDYETSYTTGGVGAYAMKLTAKTANGEYSITDAFEVRETVPFDIERNSATRLFPPATYPMQFAVKFNQDFTGTIEETVPGFFAISPLEGSPSFELIQKALEDSSNSDVLGASIFGLSLPFDEPHPVSLGFGRQLRDQVQAIKYTDFGLLGHDGVDFDMPEGTPVLAVDDGVIVRARTNSDYGTTMVVRHSWGQSYYGHLSEMTKQEGDTVTKGHPIGLSGQTGLATGPHLHFGIKPNTNDADNGYYGKINPWPYLANAQSVSDVLAAETEIATGSGQPVIESPDESSQVLRWQVSAKAGEQKTFGYSYQVPNISPQFYLVGPLTLREEGEGALVFAEARQWQLAVDADGSGTNSVTPTSGTISATDQTYTFTFTAAETMDSGGFTISVPSGWTAPQTSSNSTAGYTTAVGNSNATVATIYNNADSTTGWTYDDSDFCQGSVTVDATIKQEGTGSLKCDLNGGTPDAGDSFGYDLANQNWSSYTQISYWIRSDDGTSAGDVQAAYDNAATCAGPIQEFNVAGLTADTWTYQKHTLTATRTNVDTFCFNDGNGTGLDADIIWVDDLMIGPGTPTVTGSGPWTISVRILDAANTETFTVVYGDTSGSANGDVTNSASSGVHTFTTQSRISDAGTLADIAAQPTVTLSGGGPTIDQLMRHGAWFDSGTEQPFTF